MTLPVWTKVWLTATWQLLFSGGMGYELVEVATEDDWRAFHAIRRSTLWEAQGLNGYNERHPDDYAAGHHPLLLKLDDRPVGSVRLDEHGEGTAVVRLVAISVHAQGLGHGRALMDLVEPFAARLGIATLLVNASPNATGFYGRFGWQPFVWDLAEQVGVASDCTQMRKRL